MVPRVSVLYIDKDAGAFERSVEWIYFIKIKANVTPEVLAQLHSKKIILESTNQQQTKGRYSVVIFDIYGTLTLDNDVLSVSTLKRIVSNH